MGDLSIGTSSRAAVLALIAIAPGPLSGQHLLSPSPHFGSFAVPAPVERAYLGANLDRFTEFGKEVDANGQFLFDPYNAYETIGLNFLHYSTTAKSSRFAGLFYTATLQLGYGHDRPTKKVQDWIHDQRGLLHVPTRRVRNDRFDAALFLEANHWRFPVSWLGTFVGGGVGVGTVAQEIYLQGGLRTSWAFAMGRAGLPIPGDAFRANGLSEAYLAGLVGFTVPLTDWMSHLFEKIGGPGLRWLGYLFPDVSGSLRWDTGYFERPDGSPIAERFAAISVAFGHGRIVFETWNDLVGHKDKGPTGGGRLTFQFWNADVLGWLP